MSSNLMFLFAGFMAVWLFLFGYLLYISSRIGALQQQVEALEADQKADGRRQ